MVITAWVTLICFGIFALKTTLSFLMGRVVNIPTAIFGFISILITALSAGVIWGGLFQ